LHAEKVIEYVSSAISVNNTIEDNLYKAYLSLFRKEIVQSKEIDTLEAWLKDYQYCIHRK
jgi:hypothetical protein